MKIAEAIFSILGLISTVIVIPVAIWLIRLRISIRSEINGNESKTTIYNGYSGEADPCN